MQAKKLDMKGATASEPGAILAAARWIGFSEEVVQALQAPGPALQPALALLAQLPALRAQHAARGIPAAVTQATVRDMELWLRKYRHKHGTWGFDQAAWANSYFSGRLYALGRLQFEMGVFDLPAVPGVLQPGDPVLQVHIPATGKLEDDECGQALQQAGEFFPRYFPDHAFRALVCVSWMMNPQLAHGLPPTANLVRFLRRFQPLPLPDGTDDQMWERVFGGRVADLAAAPRDTALRRAILDHLAAGGRWPLAAGYILRRERA